MALTIDVGFVSDDYMKIEDIGPEGCMYITDAGLVPGAGAGGGTKVVVEGKMVEASIKAGFGNE